MTGVVVSAVLQYSTVVLGSMTGTPSGLALNGSRGVVSRRRPPSVVFLWNRGIARSLRCFDEVWGMCRGMWSAPRPDFQEEEIHVVPRVGK